jgi:hypothetical protein
MLSAAVGSPAVTGFSRADVTTRLVVDSTVVPVPVRVDVVQAGPLVVDDPIPAIV